MLQSQAAEPENGIDPASDKKLPGAPAKPKRTPDDATPRQPARRSAPGVQVRPLPASHTRPEDTPPPPALYPAEQRGLRSPTLPKLLPMDLDGKIHS